MNTNALHNYINIAMAVLSAVTAFLLATGCTATAGVLECSHSFVNPKYTAIILALLPPIKLVINIVRDGFAGMFKPQPPVVQAPKPPSAPGSTAGVILLILVLGLTMTACARFQAGLEKTNAWFEKYGPIIGKDLLMVGNIIVQAECSPALVPATATAINLANSPKLLQITGATSSDASRVTSILTANQDIAELLCPLVIAIRGQVGSVPAGTPSQVIPTVAP